MDLAFIQFIVKLFLLFSVLCLHVRRKGSLTDEISTKVWFEYQDMLPNVKPATRVLSSYCSSWSDHSRPKSWKYRSVIIQRRAWHQRSCFGLVWPYNFCIISPVMVVVAYSRQCPSIHSTKSCRFTLRSKTNVHVQGFFFFFGWLTICP